MFNAFFPYSFPLCLPPKTLQNIRKILPNTHQTSLPLMSTLRVLPEKKPKSQDRPSASRPASRRPELVLLLLLSAQPVSRQPGPSCLCRGCTRASTHTCRMIQLHGTPGAAGSLRMMLSPCGWRFYFLCTCVLPGVLCGTHSLAPRSGALR